MPGGQYTNLREQAASMGVSHRWPEIARTYAEVNQLFGDIVKVTPSSKVVGDMALFLFSRGIKPADVVNLEPGSTPFPESVIDMLTGGLGWPEGGWPEPVWRAVLGEKRFAEAKARYLSDVKKVGRVVPAAAPKNAAHSLATVRKELAEKLRREPSDDDLYSHLMYPQVFADFAKHQQEFDDVSTLPTPAFFYGLQPGEEISVEIEKGKTLIIRLVSVGAPDKNGVRTVNYELNGIAREAAITDRNVAVKSKSRPKADLADPRQVAAPIPGLIASLGVSVGAKVAKGDKLLMMEAMKMQTTVYAPMDGVVAEVPVALGETVEAKDLLVKLRPAS
jgi:pyruvate carboxylase